MIAHIKGIGERRASVILRKRENPLQKLTELQSYGFGKAQIENLLRSNLNVQLFENE
jgi:hypothetical protein